VTFPDSLYTPISKHSDHSVHFEYTEHFDFHFDTNNMAQPPPHERTMSELTTPEFTYDSLCI